MQSPIAIHPRVLKNRRTRSHYVPIVRRDTRGAGADAEFGQYGEVEFAQAAASLSVRLQAKNLLLESEVGGQGIRKLERDWPVEAELHGLRFDAGQFQRFKM